ncbi:MAG TPA: C25 family cysteine peptidase [Pirellulaceae bacterium]|nr:C25 family cysteine peptidase [Pirellulaceae bacterium]HMO91257.1 C25 family cysteine peptidase [Pirellulaceae bacterium]HMP68559.1 C25 family cysteine peptidase [Pirellulaceae bacterium]
MLSTKIAQRLSSWLSLVPVVIALAAYLSHFENRLEAFCQTVKSSFEEPSSDSGSEKFTLVVLPSGFDAALQPWIELRRSQGFVIQVMRPKTTAYGLTSEIRKRHKNSPLANIVLIGDALNDSAPELVVPTDYVPAVVNVRLGSEPEIATDNSFADLTGNGLPDVPIGRMSVKTADELAVLVKKIIDYETSSDFGLWRRRIDFTAGTGGFGPVIDRAIESTAKQMITDLVPSSYETTMTFASWTSPYCPDPRRFTQTTVANLSRGGLFWVYIGHGHPQRLDYLQVPGGYFPIFGIDDCSELSCEATQPIGLMLSCYVNAFDFQNDCLGEKLIRSPGGPIAVVGGTRVTMPYAMSLIALNMINDYFVSGESTTLGELLLRSKLRLLESGADNEYRQMIDTMGKLFSPFADSLDDELLEHVKLFHILGDPLLTLRRPSTIKLAAPNSAIAGSTILIKGVADMDGKLTLEFCHRRDQLPNRTRRRKEFVLDHELLCEFHDTYMQSNDHVCVAFHQSVMSGDFEVELKIPENVKGPMVVRAHIESENDFALGEVHVVVEKSR